MSNNGKPVPLSPNWWLSKSDDPVAVRVLVDPAWDEPRFEIARGDEIDFEPNEGTVSRGVGRSPWTGETIDDEYIRANAREDHLSETMFAVAIKGTTGMSFRAPTEQDRGAVAEAEAALENHWQRWIAADLVPNERLDPCHPKYDPRRWGITTFSDFFTPAFHKRGNA